MVAFLWKRNGLGSELNYDGVKVGGRCVDIFALVGCMRRERKKLRFEGFSQKLYLFVKILGLVQVFSPSGREEIITKNSN